MVKAIDSRPGYTEGRALVLYCLSKYLRIKTTSPCYYTPETVYSKTTTV